MRHEMPMFNVRSKLHE